MPLSNMMDGFEQHATGTARRVIDGFAFLRVQDVDHQAHDWTRRVELASLLVRSVGKFLDEIFVRLSENVSVVPRKRLV